MKAKIAQEPVRALGVVLVFLLIVLGKVRPDDLDSLAALVAILGGAEVTRRYTLPAARPEKDEDNEVG